MAKESGVPIGRCLAFVSFKQRSSRDHPQGRSKWRLTRGEEMAATFMFMVLLRLVTLLLEVVILHFKLNNFNLLLLTLLAPQPLKL